MLFTFSSLRLHGLLALAVFSTCLTCGSQGQPPQTKKQAKEKAPAAPVDEELLTNDGLRLACRYFPGPDSKETIPIVMLHDVKGSMGDFERLALYLQSSAGGGNSVIVPDLRGHGRSTRFATVEGGKPREIVVERMRREDYLRILRFDLESVKRYLIDRHNEEKLNIDALVVIGAKVGGVLALHWTARDWSWPQLPGFKQGQDVKAVVVLTPIVSFKGINSLPPFDQANLRDHISLLLLYGANDMKVMSAVRRIEGPLEKVRQTEFDSPEERIEKQSLYVEGLDTSLQGTDLLTDQQLPTAKGIKLFIDRRVRGLMAEDFPWKARRSPIP